MGRFIVASLCFPFLIILGMGVGGMFSPFRNEEYRQDLQNIQSRIVQIRLPSIPAGNQGTPVYTQPSYASDQAGFLQSGSKVTITAARQNGMVYAIAGSLAGWVPESALQ